MSCASLYIEHILFGASMLRKRQENCKVPRNVILSAAKNLRAAA